MWKIDAFHRKLIQIDINVSTIDHKDESMYCGTSTGDIMKIKLNYHHNADVLDPVNPPIMGGCYAKINNKAKLPQNKIFLFANGKKYYP